MHHGNYFKDLFDTIPDYRKIVLLLFLIENDVDLLTEIGLLKHDINRVCVEFKNFQMNKMKITLIIQKIKKNQLLNRF